jgi:hypothetical protein
MNCQLCKKDPFSHSFQYFGTTVHGENLLYTSPARATARETTQSFETLKLHIQEYAGKPWIWVLDCSNMELHSMYTMGFSMAIADILAKEHMRSLSHILVLSPNGWIYRVLHALRPEVLERVWFADTHLERNSSCVRFGFSSEAKTWLSLAMTRSPNQTLPAL